MLYEVITKGQFKEIVKAGAEVIQSYQVSEAFDLNSLINENLIPANFAKKLSFKSWGTEADGLLNIAKTSGMAEKKNAVLLKIEVNSETDIIKRMDFAFSDIAKIFVNNKAVWQGSDVYMSRDYRFVITSYSIHYTKLYEGNPSSTNAQSGFLHTGSVIFPFIVKTPFGVSKIQLFSLSVSSFI